METCLEQETTDCMKFTKLVKTFSFKTGQDLSIHIYLYR